MSVYWEVRIPERVASNRERDFPNPERLRLVVTIHVYPANGIDPSG
jgi:hypothetical protein